MRSGIRSLLALGLVCILMNAGVFAFASSLDMPEALTIIESEAFYEASSIDKVILAENVTEIRERAFMNSSLSEILLPESVEFIADDAFDGCDNLVITVYKDSYAHRWAAFSDVRYEVLDESAAEGQYSINGIELKQDADGVYAAAQIETGESCILRFYFLDDEDESVLISVSAGAEAGRKGEYMRLPVENALPEYFILEAVLLDQAGKALTEPVRDIRHTRAYAQAEDAGAEDYPSDRVLDFGDAGFAVLAEGVVRVPGEANLSGSRYSFSASDFDGNTPAVGDILMLNVNGIQTPVKVGSVLMGKSGTITVEADADLCLSDVYDKLSINGHMETDGSSAGLEVGNVINYDETFVYGNGILTVNVKCGMSIYVTAEYDKKNLGKDYFLFDVDAHVWGNGIATLEGEYSTKEGEIELDIYSGKVIIPVINLPADLTVTLPFNAGVQGIGVVDIGFDKLIGFKWDTKSGFVEKEEPGNHWADAELEVNFHADAGPEVTLDIGIWDFFGAKISGQVGVNATGTLFGKMHAGYEPPVDDDQIHACDSCLSIDADIFATANANIYYNITEDFSGDLLDKEIFYIDEDLMDMYISIINEKESIFGGKLEKGFGICPNNKYRVSVFTQDMYGQPIEGIDVGITGSNGSRETLVSPDDVYLYDARYTAEASFDSGSVSTEFSVAGCPKDVVIKEEELIIQGTVTDKHTGQTLQGVLVKLTLPNGKTLNAYTDSKGGYCIDKLGRGTYAISFSKDGYMAKTFSDLEYENGYRVSFDTALVPLCLPVISAHTGNETKRVQALTADGTCPHGIPKVFIAVETNNWIEKVTISHENCSQDFVYQTSWYTMAMDFFGVDMGNGEYTYVLQLANSGTGMGHEAIVMRETDGRLEIIKEFTGSNFSDNIDIQASFSDNTHFSGTILPTNIRINGEMPLPYSGFKRTGKTISDEGLGSMSYELNEDGVYDLVFSIRTTAGGYNWDNIGSIITRYVMEEGSLVLASQSYKMYEGGTVTIS